MTNKPIPAALFDKVGIEVLFYDRDKNMGFMNWFFSILPSVNLYNMMIIKRI
jgi:hypothetical protein